MILMAGRKMPMSGRAKRQKFVSQKASSTKPSSCILTKLRSAPRSARTVVTAGSSSAANRAKVSASKLSALLIPRTESAAYISMDAFLTELTRTYLKQLSKSVKPSPGMLSKAQRIAEIANTIAALRTAVAHAKKYLGR